MICILALCSHDNPAPQKLTRMKHGYGEFNVAEMSGTLSHVLAARRTSVGTIDTAELGVVETLLAWPLALLIHGLWVLDVANTHVLGLFRREESKLDLLHRLQRRLRVREAGCGRHGCDGSLILARLALELLSKQEFSYQKHLVKRATRVRCSSLQSPLLKSRCCSSAAACVHPFDTAQSA